VAESLFARHVRDPVVLQVKAVVRLGFVN